MKLGPLKDAWVRKGTVERIAPLDVQEIKRIAVIKHGALGDLVHTRPMILNLRRHFPEAAITFSGISSSTRGIPTDLVDRVHISCGRERKYTFRETYRAAKALGPQDIVFDITQSSRSHWLSLITPAHLKIGYIHRGVERLVYDVAIHRAGLRFEAETFLEQLNVLGFGFDWPLTYGYPKLTAPLSGKYVVYFPTASVDYKVWPAERFVELIEECATRFPQHRHVVLRGLAEWEQAICDSIVARLAGIAAVESFEGGPQTDALIANADLLVANDTGVRNVAIATDTPTVGLFVRGPLFGYIPLFGCHEAAYTADGTAPEVGQVLQLCEKLLGEKSSASQVENP